MCLATPIQIKEIKGDTALVSAESGDKEINLSLVKEAKVGDWLLVHGNVAVNKIEEKEAKEILELIECSCE